MKPGLLVLIPVRNEHREMIARHFEAHYVSDAQNQASEQLAGYAHVRVVLTNGTVGCSARQLAALPQVELICALGAGYENIDLNA